MKRRAAAIVILAAVLAALVYWASGNAKVDALNEAIRRNGSHALRDYPYQFRVLRLEDGVATMTTPRSPHDSNTGVTNPASLLTRSRSLGSPEKLKT